MAQTSLHTASPHFTQVFFFADTRLTHLGTRLMSVKRTDFEASSFVFFLKMFNFLVLCQLRELTLKLLAASFFLMMFKFFKNICESKKYEKICNII